jgi:hypothetical protein
MCLLEECPDPWALELDQTREMLCETIYDYESKLKAQECKMDLLRYQVDYWHGQAMQLEARLNAEREKNRA